MKSRYYEAELAYLREQGREFAAAFPATASLLAERSDDPDVERLLEGFAFLASRVRERIDDAIPELATQFAAALVPQLTRFIPSTAVIAFQPDPRSLRGVHTIPRGTQVGGDTARGVRCVFQTTSALDLLPVGITEVRTERPGSRTERIILRLQIPENALATVGAHRIRLHFHGELPAALTLRAWFLRHCVSIQVVEAGKTRATIKQPIAPVGFDRETRLLPERPLEHDAFTHIVELFAAPLKFAFVDLPKLGECLTPASELHFTFDRPPKLPRPPSKDEIRLHCVPVVNLFASAADPVRFRPLHPESIVRAAEHASSDAEIFDVTEVLGVAGAQRTSYQPFTAFRGGPDRAGRYFVTRRTASVTDNGTDVYLSLISPRDHDPAESPETLAVDVLCTNRALAPTLKVGEINQPMRGSGTMVPFVNITAVTPPLYPLDNVELLWRLGAHLGLSRAGLQDAGNLRRLLEVYNFAERSNPQLGRKNAQWIDAIREVQTRKVVRLVRGAPVTGTKSIVVLDEAGFAAIGEALVLGDALCELFARRMPINSFHQLSIALAPSQWEYAWPPRYGERTIL